ncbi:polycomb group protein Pc [Exaiptasia diaphana]|uniref:Uncharacterized protein n=1 Tax=Exaiptasia diaphana TaxID=2652724 RepID=A0A913WV61_EXADI|nr:polycomb group protein Pc [Exaiptasia diaphana]KXJ27857.1 hypothetical protein AC249_AIPGENE9011 [Exaiptasia diaphana]
MSEEIFHDGIGKAPVLTCKRNGHIQHLKEKESDMNDRTEQEWIPVDGFPNSFRRGHEVGATSSGIKRHKSNHHDHGKHYHKQSHHHHHHHHHHKRSSGISHMNSDQKRFCKTASALKQAGLLELTLQTAQLIQENENLQKEIDSLQQQTLEFSKSLQVQLEEKVNKAKPQNGFT